MRKRSLILSIHKEREREAVRERLEHEGGRCVWYQNQKHLGGGGAKSQAPAIVTRQQTQW